MTHFITSPPQNFFRELYKFSVLSRNRANVRAEKNLSKSFDLVTRTNSVDDKYFDIKLMSTHYVFRQISKLVFTAFHLFFTYQNIFLCVERSQFYTKTSFFATNNCNYNRNFWPFLGQTCRNLSSFN